MPHLSVVLAQPPARVSGTRRVSVNTAQLICAFSETTTVAMPVNVIRDATQGLKFNSGNLNVFPGWPDYVRVGSIK